MFVFVLVERAEASTTTRSGSGRSRAWPARRAVADPNLFFYQTHSVSYSIHLPTPRLLFQMMTTTLSITKPAPLSRPRLRQTAPGLSPERALAALGSESKAVEDGQEWGEWSNYT